jgi:hypothetical protein
MSTPPVPGSYIAVTLTPVEVRAIARMICSDLASECEETFSARLPGRDEIAALRVTIDAYAKQLDMLKWGETPADIEMVCPADVLDGIALDLLACGEKTIHEHDVAVCAVVGVLARGRGVRIRAPKVMAKLAGDLSRAIAAESATHEPSRPAAIGSV